MINSNRLSKKAQVEYDKIVEMYKSAGLPINISGIEEYCKALDRLWNLNPCDYPKIARKSFTSMSLLNERDDFEALFDKRK